MDLRIGVTQAPRELSLELDEGTDRDALKDHIDSALSDSGGVLWLTDKRGRQVAIPAGKVAYIEFSPPEGDRRIGFGA